MFDATRLGHTLVEKYDIALNQQFAIGFSGGADSTALLVAIWELLGRHDKNQSTSQADQLVAFHYNHGISRQADDWQKHCQRICDHLGVPMHSAKWPKDLPPLATEAKARAARYAWFEQVIKPEQLLLTGHHSDDQAETILMNLLQGAGSERIGGIPPLRSLGSHDGAMVCRPLLDYSRHELEHYLRSLNYQWIDDPENRNDRHARNFIRHQVIPILKQRWPEATTAINRSGRSIESTNRMINAAFNRLLDKIEASDKRRLFCLCAPLHLDPDIHLFHDETVQLIRQWVINAEYRPPSFQQLNSIITMAGDWESAECSIEKRLSNCRVQWSDLQIRQSAGHLFLIPEVLPRPDRDADVSAVQYQTLGGLTTRFTPSLSVGLDPLWLENGRLKWRWRAGGETVRLPGRDHHTSLKKAYQQANVPAWERDRLPYLVLNNEIVWVDGVGLCGKAAKPRAGAQQILPSFSLNKAGNKTT